eukprot:1160393-Pelagomonas_calceolata.AAC.21
MDTARTKLQNKSNSHQFLTTQEGLDLCSSYLWSLVASPEAGLSMPRVEGPDGCVSISGQPRQLVVEHLLERKAACKDLRNACMSAWLLHKSMQITLRSIPGQHTRQPLMHSPFLNTGLSCLALILQLAWWTIGFYSSIYYLVSGGSKKEEQPPVKA